MMTCIGEPISWPRLERYVLAGGDAAIGEHVAACAACRQCLDEIERDVVALPPLVVPVKRRWWKLAVPIAGALAAAALLLLLLRPREPREGVASVKGLGDVQIDVVRERAGIVRDDVRSFAPGDRWKVVVTCPPDRPAWLDVAVVEAGAAHADYPLAPARVTCGNRIVVPGAFSLTGDKPHRVCVRVGVAGEPARSLPAPGDACLTLRPD